MTCLRHRVRCVMMAILAANVMILLPVPSICTLNRSVPFGVTRTRDDCIAPHTPDHELVHANRIRTTEIVYFTLKGAASEVNYNERLD